MRKKEKTEYKILVVDQALNVLEQFLESHAELGLSDLSTRLNLQKNKVFRILATLENRGYIERNAKHETYRLGLKNLRLCQNFMNSMGLIRHARPVLETILEKCKETSYVSVMNDFDIIYLSAVESELPVRVVPRVGSRLPFYCTEAGKVLAANMSLEAFRENIKTKTLKQFTSNTICDPDELFEQLRNTARIGYAVDNEELEVGVRCIGAPIRDYKKNIIGAVSVSGPSMRFSQERMEHEIIPLVKEAADEISMKLGFRGNYVRQLTSHMQQ